jgi:glycosyltransferase involved in cell wall biosynthesis
MTVLQIISSGGMYGAEAVILNLSDELHMNGHKSVVAVFSNLADENVELHNVATLRGIESHLIPCSGQMDRTVGEKIRALVKKTGADVVHAHGYKADIYCYFALRGTGVSKVSTCHTWYDNDWRVTLYGKIDRLLLRGFDGVVAVSDVVKAQLLAAGVKADKVTLIRNGIGTVAFEGVTPSLRDEFGEGELLVGLVGRLSREKGVDVYIRAAAEVLKELPGVRFVVVGDGPDRVALAALIEELGVGARVSLLGPRSDMPAVYASLDLMVSASREEGLPMAILEGLASGRALIATNVGAVPMVIRDGDTGVLLAPEDVSLLVGAMRRLLQDAALRKRLGAAGKRVIAAEFSAARMTTDYLRMYEAAGAGDGRRSGVRA